VAFVPHEQNVFGDPKKRETPKKVLLLHSTFANKNYSGLPFLLTMATFLRLVQKRFLGSEKKDGTLLG
jgi:hypothetical protein